MFTINIYIGTSYTTFSLKLPLLYVNIQHKEFIELCLIFAQFYIKFHELKLSKVTYKKKTQQAAHYNGFMRTRSYI